MIDRTQAAPQGAGRLVTAESVQAVYSTRGTADLGRLSEVMAPIIRREQARADS